MLHRIGLLVLAVVVMGVPLAKSEPVEIALKDPSYFNDARIDVKRLPEFSQQGSVITARLANDFKLIVDRDKLAVRVVAPSGVVLAENEPGKIVGLEYIPGGLGPQVKAYPAELKFKFRRTLALGESVTLDFEATSQDNKTATVEWTFVPVRYTINGKVMNGVADQYYIHDVNHYLYKLWMNWLGPVGKDFEGARSYRFACYAKESYAEALFGIKRPNQSLADWGMFIDSGQMFQAVGLPNDRGTIIEFMDEPFSCRSGLMSNPANTAVNIYYMVYLGRLAADYTTPLRVRLLTREPLSHNLWMEMARYMKVKFQNLYGVKPTDPMPMVCNRNEWRDTTFVDYYKKWLPVHKEYGFRRVEIGWVWYRGRTLSSWEIWPSFREWTGKELKKMSHSQTDVTGVVTSNCGGIDGLAQTVKMAHDLGIEIFVWHQTSHGWRGSPEIRDHPEWVSRNPDGTMQGWGDDFVPTIWFDLQSGWKDLTLKRLADLKRATNLDGIWCDVYGAGANANFIKPICGFSMWDRSDYFRQIRDMGYKVYTEGVSLESVDSYVIYDKDVPSYKKNPFVLYGACPFRTGNLIRYGQMDLFKLMGYQSFPQDREIVYNPAIAGDAQIRRDHPAYAAEVKYRNRCVNEIVDRLGTAIGVQETSAGTQWICPKGNALFFWEAGKIKVKSATVRQANSLLTSQGDVAVPVLNKEGTQWELEVPARSVLLLENTTKH